MLKLCTVTGRQISVKDLCSNKVGFVPITESVERITCITSNYYMEKSVMAIAFTEGEAEDTVSI